MSESQAAPEAGQCLHECRPGVRERLGFLRRFGWYLDIAERHREDAESCPVLFCPWCGVKLDTIMSPGAVLTLERPGTCGQQLDDGTRCMNEARYAFRWPGVIGERLICEAHSAKAVEVGRVVGVDVELRPIGGGRT